MVDFVKVEPNSPLMIGTQKAVMAINSASAMSPEEREAFFSTLIALSVGALHVSHGAKFVDGFLSAAKDSLQQPYDVYVQPTATPMQ